jgi:uncharacterized protein YneF (UPF0154 family)
MKILFWIMVYLVISLIVGIIIGKWIKYSKKRGGL